MRPLAFASLLLVSMALGCGEQNVIVASAFDGGGAQDGPTVEGGTLPPPFEGGGGQSCSRTQDCLEAEFCAKPSCDAPRGQCQPPPDSCGDGLAAVCGCDDITYWNDCLRQRDGVPASTQGQCTTQFKSCGGGGMEKCPGPDESCSRLAGPSESCNVNSPGVCWVLPYACPADAGAPEWKSCGGGPGPPSCTTLCAAIRSEAPYEQSNVMCP
jgi:hypothetical protein